jgi:hypothetical protein
MNAHMKEMGGVLNTYLPINVGDVALSFILEGRHFSLALWFM